MILKWIQSMTPGSEAQAARQKDEEERKSRGESKLVDVAHEALARSASEDRQTLGELVRFGLPHVERQRFKGKVREKVWDVVSEGFGAAPSDMIEEITERIVDAAEADPFYKRMFDRG